MYKNFLDLNMIKNKKVMIATPVYGADVKINFFSSMIDLMVAIEKHSLPISFITINNESLITRARNRLCDVFMSSDYDYLFFIDSDISFTVEDIFYTIFLAETQNMPIITAPYPQKEILWSNIKKANDFNLLSNDQSYNDFSSRFGIGFKDSNKKVVIKEPLEVDFSSTGFMLISRKVFESFDTEYKNKLYYDRDLNKEMMAYFDCEIDDKTKAYLSEDYSFCKRARELGYSVWLLPWMELNHYGTHLFSGKLANYLDLSYRDSKEL